MRGWVRAADVAALRTTVSRDRGRAGAAVSRTSVLADRGIIWPVLGGGLLAVPAARRAGMAALCAVAAEAALTKAIKPMVGRTRPPWWQRLRSRDHGRQPGSGSMPSSHTGNAVAFATACALQAPGVAAPLLVLAGLVGASRLTTARHYPSDVAVGLLTGLAVGSVVGLLIRRRGARRAAHE